MKKNLGVSDRIIRFVLFDLLLGVSYLGLEVPSFVANTTFVFSLFLLLSLIIGYSPLYHLFGLSTVDTKQDNYSAS